METNSNPNVPDTISQVVGVRRYVARQRFRDCAVQGEGAARAPFTFSRWYFDQQLLVDVMTAAEAERRADEVTFKRDWSDRHKIAYALVVAGDVTELREVVAQGAESKKPRRARQKQEA